MQRLAQPDVKLAGRQARLFADAFEQTDPTEIRLQSLQGFGRMTDP
jgi:hypothetical protein